MPQRCLGRITKNEGFTFGDGVTPFYFEYRCEEDANTCKLEHHSKITELFPENLLLFSPTKYFIQAMKRHGLPESKVLKKAIDAHKKVIESMKGEPIHITYYETEETFCPLSEIHRGHAAALIPTKKGSKILYKDPITGLFFDKCEDGGWIFVQNPPNTVMVRRTKKENTVESSIKLAKATNEETVVLTDH